MKFISNYLKNRAIKKFIQQEEIRLEKERIQAQTDLKIQKIHEDKVKKEQQYKCTHNYIEIGKNKRTITHMFGLKENYYVYDLLCTKCDKEILNTSEENRNYNLNKSKLINNEEKCIINFK